MTFWPLTNSDLPTNQTFHQFHDLYTELGLHRIMSGFHGAFATGVASQQGTLTLPDTWFRPPFWDLLMLQLLRPNSSNLPCLYSTFHLEYPLVLSRFYFQHFQGQNIYFNKMPAPPPQNQMVVSKLRTQNGSTSLGEKSDEQETRTMLAAGQCPARLRKNSVRHTGIFSYQSCM